MESCAPPNAAGPTNAIHVHLQSIQGTVSDCGFAANRNTVTCPLYGDRDIYTRKRVVSLFLQDRYFSGASLCICLCIFGTGSFRYKRGMVYRAICMINKSLNIFAETIRHDMVRDGTAQSGTIGYLPPAIACAQALAGRPTFCEHNVISPPMYRIFLYILGK